MEYVIGIDYGTGSCRAILVNAYNGEEIAHSVYEYPRWKRGMYCIPEKQQYRQHPLDYLEGLEYTIKGVLENQPEKIKNNIRGIGIDTTGSTIVAVNKNGVPLSLIKGFEENPNAMFILWKDHTAVSEAAEINAACKNNKRCDYTQYCGGIYSAEFYFSKVLHILRIDKEVRENVYTFIEHADYIPAVLTGVKDAIKIKRCRCAAGHKALWNKKWGGFPDREFFEKIDGGLGRIRESFVDNTYTSDYCAGNLCKEWAGKLGLRTDVKVSVGCLDAHTGAIGAYIKSNCMVKVMGTSVCDIIVKNFEENYMKPIAGICGEVDGSVIPGMIGMEAGQSAVGDIYNWFKKILSYPLMNVLDKDNIEDMMLYNLEKEASGLNISDVVSLDWFNGRRTPFANQNVKGAITGLDLSVTAPMIYRSLIEGTSFGARAIIEQLKKEGVEIDEVIAVGGVAKKSPLNMQITADVLQIPIKVAENSQTVALGAAIIAATSSGIYKTIEQAQIKMASRIEKIYMPNKENFKKYNCKYKEYLKIGAIMENIRDLK